LNWKTIQIIMLFIPLPIFLLIHDCRSNEQRTNTQKGDCHIPLMLTLVNIIFGSANLCVMWSKKKSIGSGKNGKEKYNRGRNLYKEKNIIFFNFHKFCTFFGKKILFTYLYVFLKKNWEGIEVVRVLRLKRIELHIYKKK